MPGRTLPAVRSPLVIVAALLVAACASDSEAALTVPAPRPDLTTTVTTSPQAPTNAPPEPFRRPPLPTPPPASFAVTVETAVPFTADLTLDVYRPDAAGLWPMVVLMPGGAWDSADPRATAPLARDLAARGAVVLNGTYRVRAPDAFADVVCAIRLGYEQAARWDADPARLVVAGHSAGAHVSAVAALGGAAFPADCAATTPYAPPKAWVGVAGPYDVATFEVVPELRAFFGGSRQAAPDAWQAGDPATYASAGAGTEVHLVHGRTDLAVLPVFSLQFASRLGDAGRDVAVYLIDSANHADIIDPAENGPETAGVIFAAAS